jgi:glycosyltransferase involved in cell wall biosynthesis
VKIALSVADMSVGGIATFVLNLSQSLCRVGHEVMVIAQRPGEWWPRLAEIGVQGYCLPRRRWDSVQQAAQRFAAYLTAQQIDLLLVNIGIDNRLPMLALHLLPDTLPVVLALRNDRPEVYALAAINQRRWNCAVAVSPKVQQHAVAHFGQKTVLCIPNGVDAPADDHLHIAPDWSTPLRLLFVGRLDDHQKGIFRLPAILAACRQRQLPIRLTIIGNGPDQTQLRQLFQRAGVADLVDLHGFQPHEQVLAAMDGHHGLLLPSNYEGLPNVLLEAQAHGCVPIAARLPGITDYVVQDGISGFLVNPPEIEGYVNRIEQLLVPERWRALRNTGMGLIRQHFSIQSMGECYLALFTELERGAYPRSPNHFRLRPPACLRFGWRDYLPAPLVLYLRRLEGKLLKVAQQR